MEREGRALHEAVVPTKHAVRHNGILCICEPSPGDELHEGKENEMVERQYIEYGATRGDQQHRRRPKCGLSEEIQQDIDLQFNTSNGLVEHDGQAGGRPGGGPGAAWCVECGGMQARGWLVLTPAVHRLHAKRWGSARNGLVVCVRGLAGPPRKLEIKTVCVV